MSSFSALKTAIQAAIKQNGNNEITGDILQDILLSIVSTLGDSAINNLETGLQTESQTRGNDDAALSQAIENEATARGNADTALGNLITGIKNNIDNGYVYAGIATPSTTPVSGKVFYIATQAGTYTNLGNTAVKPGMSILKYNGSEWSNEQVIYTDGGVFDVSAYNGGATYASLEALLSDANLLTIIPPAVRKDGMSIKFVSSVDNKYVQQRFLLSGSFTTAQFTNPENWYNETIKIEHNILKVNDDETPFTSCMWASDPKSCHYPAVLDILVEINGKDWSDIQIYSVRKDGDYLKFNIKYTYTDSTPSPKEISTAFSVELGLQDINEAEVQYLGNTIYLKYNKNLLSTAQNDNKDLLSDSAIFKSNELYTTSSLLNSGIYRGFLKRVSCVDTELPESITITRIRNQANNYFYFVASINGVSYNFSGETRLYDSIENIQLANIIFTIDTSLVSGDCNVNVNAVVDVHKIYSNLSACEKKIIDNRNRINSWAKDPESIHYPSIIDVWADIKGADWNNIAIYSVRKDGDNITISISYSYTDSVGIKNSSAALSTPLGENNINDVVFTYYGNDIHVRYDKTKLVTVTNSNKDYLSDDAIHSNGKVLYSTQGLLNSGIKIGFLKRVSCTNTNIPTSIVITRIRNSASAYFYFVASIDGVSYNFGGETRLYDTIENIQLSNIIFTIDTSLVSGDNYANVNATVDTYKIIASLEQFNEKPFDNNLISDGVTNGLSVISGSYGSSGARYKITPPRGYAKLHLYVEFKFNSMPAFSNSYIPIVTVGGNVVQFVYNGVAVNSTGLVTSQSFFGINYSSQSIWGEKKEDIIGKSAFSIRYTGDLSNTDVVLNITSSSVIIKHSEGETIHSVSYAATDTISTLIEALSVFDDIEIIPVEVTNHVCSELLYDASINIPLVYTYTKDDGSGDTYIDAPRTILPYAHNTSVHSIEIVSGLDDSYFNVAFDGIFKQVQKNDLGDIVLGNASLPVTFQNLHISFTDYEDAEIVTNTQSTYGTSYQMISNHNPRLIVWEGHGVDACMETEMPLSDDMAISTDRLNTIFDALNAKGYVPVTWPEVISWKINRTPLPKRCYCIMMDDFRVENCVNPQKRTPFNRYNVMAGLAIIEDYNRSDSIIIDGEQYTKGETTDICEKAGWYTCSHAKHYRLGSQKISDLFGIFIDCVKSCDKLGLHSDVIVYPYGSYKNVYPQILLTPFKLGVMTTAVEYNCLGSSDFYITRYDFGYRTPLSQILGLIN